VNSTRSLWFESHLFADPAGRRARVAAEQLGTDVHEQILAVGDQLATTSAAVAQQFYRHAAAVWQAVGANDFARWADGGQELLTVEPANRDAALAYFSVTPKAVARGGIAELAAWCAIGRELTLVSRRLGATFFESTTGMVAKVPAATLTQWAHHGARLYGTAGWRGEFLAQAYLASAATVLPILHADEFGPWADLGAALQPVLKESQFFGALPDRCAALTPAERERFLAAALAIARVHAPAAATVYTQLPAAVCRLRRSARDKLLQIFQLAGPAVAATLPEIVPVVGALIQDLPRDVRLAALDLAIEVARRFPLGSIALLRSLPVAYEDAPPAAVEHWVRRGLQIAADNADSGTAYFALESRTSVKVLHASSTAAVLSDVQGLLRKYVQMLSGRSASIRSGDAFSLRPPLEEFPLENEIALPLRIDLFDTHEDNVRVYRFLASQLAGRRECGTYEVTLPIDASGLLAFLRAPHHAAVLEEFFLVAEGFRIAANLARLYPGLASEQRAVARLILSRRFADELPPQSGLMDALFLWLLSGAEMAGLPLWLRSMVAVVAPCVAPLAHRGATVNDSLAVAQLLVEQLTEPGERRPQGSAGDLFFDKLTGNALLDQYIYDEVEPMAGDAGDAQPPPTTPPPAALPEDMKLQLQPDVEDIDGMSSPLSADELQKLIEAGADLRMKQGYSEDIEGLGLYITDLIGKLPAEQIDELRQLLKEATTTDRPGVRRWLEHRGEGASFYYDEWDYHISDYRQRWCRLREVPVEGDSGEFFNRTLVEYASVIPEVRRQFQRIRPEMYRVVRGLEDGEDFDLNAVVSARVDRRARRPPSPKLYVARTREERDVATLFLIDMSASTDEPLQKPPASPFTGNDDAALVRRPPASARRIIDVTKEALVIMAEALDEIGDAYAIYGFSGHGRHNVEFYLVKAFNESLSAAVRGRIGALEPKRSTRMGTALRHAMEKMASITSRSRHIIMLSDGFPQDFDYGQDRRSNVYGLRDTTVALREVEAAGITPFCITVDKAGHDYLREMCDGARYMVIEDIAALPHELPKIYQRVVTT